MPVKSCALARQELTSAVQALRETPLREKITTGIKAGFVGSIVTPMRAVAGNASWGTFLQLARSPLASAIDLTESIGKSAATGFKQKPYEFRDYVNTLDADGMGVLVRGFKKGAEPISEAFNAAKVSESPVVAFVDELRNRLGAKVKIEGGQEVGVGNSTVEYQRTIYESKLAQTMTDGAFAILEAVDRPFWQMAFDTGLYRQAKLYGVRQGLKGKALSEESARQMSNPTAEMVMRASDEANYATFKDRNVLSTTAGDFKRTLKARADKPIDENLSPWEKRAAEKLKSGAKLADYVVETTIPFTGVPSSVAGKIVSVSPLGLLARDIRKGAQFERATALANAGIGFGMVAFGMELFEDGLLTGALPNDATEKAQWKEAGKMPFSVKIGGEWVGLKVFGPVAASLFMGAAMRRGMDDSGIENAELSKAQLQAFGKGAGESAKFLTQQTYLTQIGNIVEAASGEPGRFARIASSLALPTPALIGQINRATDPYVRDNRALVDQVKSKLPLGHLYAPTPRELGPTGPLPARTSLERFSSVASPVPISTDRDDPQLKELRRLLVSFGLPSKQVQSKGRRAEMSREQWQQLTTEAGSEAMEKIRFKMSQPGFQRLDDAEKKKVLDKIVTDSRSRYRDPMKEAILAAQMPTPPKLRR